jgi:hypothetical protein
MRSPYSGNVAAVSSLPPGYMEAATSIGRSYGNAISGIGDSIAGAIEKYRQNKEEREFLDEKFALSSAVIEKFKNIPELEKDPRIGKLIDGVGKFSSMSNTQKKAFLNNAEFAVAQLEKEEQKRYQREQDELRNNLERQRAIFDAARLQNENARTQNDTLMTNARIREMQESFTPSGSLVTLPDGTKVPVVTTSKNSAQVVAPRAAAGPESPVGKLLADRDARAAAGDKQGAAAIQAAIEKETAGGSNKLEISEKTFMANAQEYLEQLKELEDTVNKYGNFEVASPGATKGAIEASAKLDQLPYKMAITYAKIVDPQSVAREGEVAAAQKYVIPMGLLTGNDKTLAAIKNQREEIKRRVEQFRELNSDKLKGKPVPTAEQPQGTPQFKSIAEAEAARAKGFKGVVEIYDPATNRYRRARID